MTAQLGQETDAFETTLGVSAPAPVETRAAFGDTDARGVERLAMPANVLPGTGSLRVDLASTALVGLGEGARYLVDYPYGCAEQKSVRGPGVAARERPRRRVRDGPASSRPTTGRAR